MCLRSQARRETHEKLSVMCLCVGSSGMEGPAALEPGDPAESLIGPLVLQGAGAIHSEAGSLSLKWR